LAFPGPARPPRSGHDFVAPALPSAFLPYASLPAETRAARLSSSVITA